MNGIDVLGKELILCFPSFLPLLSFCMFDRGSLYSGMSSLCTKMQVCLGRDYLLTVNIRIMQEAEPCSMDWGMDNNRLLEWHLQC